MKVIVTNSSQIFGGNERWTVSTAASLAGAGLEVGLFVREGGFVERHVRELGLPARGFPGFGGDLDPRALARLVVAFREERPDAVILTNTKDYWICGLASWLTRVPVRALRLSIIRPVKNNLKYRLVYRTFVNRVVVNSREVERGIRESAAWLEAIDIDVVFNGVDPPHEGPGRVLPVPGGAFVIGACAHVTTRKRFDWVLRAMPDSAHFVLVGDGPDLPRLKGLAADRGLSGRVHFPGFDPDPRPWYPSFDLNVLPSQTEGMPNAVLEAMAAGTPTLATDCGGIRELLDDGRCGVIVERDDFEGFRAALHRLEQDRARRVELGRRARDRAGEVFSREATTAALISVLSRSRD